MNTEQHEHLYEVLSELQSIHEELLDGLDRASQLLRLSGLEMAWQRADAYWLAHAKMALTNHHGYLGGSMVTMEDTLEEIEEALDGEDDED